MTLPTAPQDAGSGVRIDPFGEGAVLVSFGDVVDVVLARRARALASAVADLVAVEPAWERPVQGLASVLVPFDPLAVSMVVVVARLEALLADGAADPPPEAAGRTIDIAVRYGGADGPDLDEVASLTGLSPADVIERHAGATVEVLALGFAPGFAYLGLIDSAIAVPRHATPRPRVEAGSVAIADRMTGIYPAASPGGWRLIGRTDTVLFDPASAAPSLLLPGDRVRFRPDR